MSEHPFASRWAARWHPVGLVLRCGLSVLCAIALGLLFLILAAWSLGAWWYSPLLPGWLSGIGAVVTAAALSGCVVSCMRTGLRRRVLVSMASLPLIPLGLQLVVQPSDGRVWDIDQQILPTVEWTHDGEVVISAFRDFHYRTLDDFDVHYREFRFSPEHLHSVAYVIQRFTPSDAMAHTFLCFEIREPVDGGDTRRRYFAVSVEIRRERGEIYSPSAGLYRNYELMYVIGSERDLLGIRTNIRRDRVWMFPTNATPAQTRRLFETIADRANRLRTRPEFYDTLFNNCTNNIVAHTRPLIRSGINWLDPRVILPGLTPSVAWKLGIIGAPDETLDALFERCRIDGIAQHFPLDDQFSTAIRGLSDSNIK